MKRSSSLAVTIRRWAEWVPGFISEGRWTSIVEQSERGVSPGL